MSTTTASVSHASQPMPRDSRPRRCRERAAGGRRRRVLSQQTARAIRRQPGSSRQASPRRWRKPASVLRGGRLPSSRAGRECGDETSREPEAIFYRTGCPAIGGHASPDHAITCATRAATPVRTAGGGRLGPATVWHLDDDADAARRGTRHPDRRRSDPGRQQPEGIFRVRGREGPRQGRLAWPGSRTRGARA